MKLGPILAQFLYQHKQLDLPGIGRFMIDASKISDTGKSFVPGVSFETKPAVAEDPTLIKFISEQSGKMKALASADFQSYLQLALQFLNIGKPFLFEGIGSLVKKTSGGFAFAPGETMVEDIKDYTAREISATTSTEESFHKARERKINLSWKQPVSILLILVSLGIVLWGGYTLYQKTKNKRNQQPVQEEQFMLIDTSSRIADSLKNRPVTPQYYKYVLEVANQKRATERYNVLRSYNWDVSLETKDSVTYMLFMSLPVSLSDTTRIKDSLSALTGRKVVIEY